MSAAFAAPDRRARSEETSFSVRIASRALRQAWDRGLLEEPALDPDILIRIAIEREQGEPEGGEWQEALAVLADDLEREAALNELGRTIAHSLLVSFLRQRIRARGLWRRRPEIFDQPIERPVIVLGHMRSGTTRLHRLLACDPQFTFTRLHETMQPVPQSRSLAVLSASLVQAFLRRCNPMLARIHPTSATAPEEEFGLHGFSLHGAMFEAQWHVPGFARWCEGRGLAPVYAEFRRLVQTLRWRRRDDGARIQLLKAPQFMQDLPALLSTFPRARIVWMQRNLDEVTASSASLVWNQQRIQSAAVDPLRIGREWRRKTRLRQERAERGLAAQSDAEVLPVKYEAMNLDWGHEVRRIYDFLDLKLPDEVVGRMSHVAHGSAHKGHSYLPEQFGLG